MRSIFLAFANPEAAAKLKKVLASAGLPVPQVCTTGTALLQLAMLSPEGGVIVLPAAAVGSARAGVAGSSA